MEPFTPAWDAQLRRAVSASAAALGEWLLVLQPVGAAGVSYLAARPDVCLLLLLAVLALLLTRFLLRLQLLTRLQQATQRRAQAVRSRYRRLVDRVARTSQALAALLPHVLYWTTAAAALLLLPAQLAVVATPAVIAAAAIYLPALRSLRLLYLQDKAERAAAAEAARRAATAASSTSARAPEAAPASPGAALLSTLSSMASPLRQRLMGGGRERGSAASAAAAEAEAEAEAAAACPPALMDALHFWIAISALELLLNMPFVARALAAVLPWWPSLHLLLVVYVSLPGLLPAALCSRAAAGLAAVVAYPATLSLNNAVTEGVLRTLVTLRLLPERFKLALQDILDDGVLVVLGLVFLFTPGFITAFGTVMVGVAFPLARSVTAVSAKPSPRTRACSLWLSYWVVGAPLAALRAGLPAVPFGNHLWLLFLLYLQLSYFRGAQRCVLFIFQQWRNAQVSSSSSSVAAAADLAPANSTATTATPRKNKPTAASAPAARVVEDREKEEDGDEKPAAVADNIADDETTSKKDK